MFATIEEARAILGARDEYVLATTPLERSAKLKVADTVRSPERLERLRKTLFE